MADAERCIAIIKQGVHKGSVCGQYRKYGPYCGHHNFQCTYTLTSGPNRGKSCTQRLTKDSKTYCKKHSNITNGKK